MAGPKLVSLAVVTSISTLPTFLALDADGTLWHGTVDGTWRKPLGNPMTWTRVPCTFEET